jgi:hypothetical protein
MVCEIVLPDHPNSWIHLRPENSKEVNQLLQLANNAKSGYVEISAHFAGDSVLGEIHIKLRQDRSTTIRNINRRRR